MTSMVDRLLRLLATPDASQYGEESVSQYEHALQCALLAEQAGASGSVIAAALLHDAGERPALRGIDDRHEEIGAEHLLEVFRPAVAEPVRLHVAAKRYLCASDPEYFGRLSRASVRSLELQGGRFTPSEAAAFRAMPYADDAIRIRLWDDAAKLPGCATPPIEHYRTTLLTALAN